MDLVWVNLFLIGYFDRECNSRDPIAGPNQGAKSIY